MIIHLKNLYFLHTNTYAYMWYQRVRSFSFRKILTIYQMDDSKNITENKDKIAYLSKFQENTFKKHFLETRINLQKNALF